MIGCLISLLLVGSTLQAQDHSVAIQSYWHQWRGPLATGEALKGFPPLKWDNSTNIRWKVALPGKGSSTPIIWGNRVFILAAVDTGKKGDDKPITNDPRFEKKTESPRSIHQFLVLCYERDSGKEIWRQIATERVPHEGHHPTHSYAASSPFTDGKRLYVNFGSRGVYCYDLEGKKLWSRDLGLMNTRYGWGEAISPVAHGDTVVINWDQEKDSYIIALDARTGETRWKKERNEPTTWATPLLIEHKGRVQVIVNGTNRVRSYNLTNGEVIWECGGQTLNAIPSPMALNGMVICMSGYRGAAAWALPLDSVGDVTEKKALLWSHNRGTPYVPSALLVGNRLYFTQANQPILTILDAITGKVILERERLPGVSSLYASPVAASGRVYLPSREGVTLVFKQGDKLEVLGVNKLDDTIDASPAIVEKQLFLRGEKHLYCIEDGEHRPSSR